jgi:hypothetical protein
MANGSDGGIFNRKMSQGAKNVIESSTALFEPPGLEQAQQAAPRYAGSMEGLLDRAMI